DGLHADDSALLALDLGEGVDRRNLAVPHRMLPSEPVLVPKAEDSLPQTFDSCFECGGCLAKRMVALEPGGRVPAAHALQPRTVHRPRVAAVPHLGAGRRVVNADVRLVVARRPLERGVKGALDVSQGELRTLLLVLVGVPTEYGPAPQVEQGAAQAGSDAEHVRH